MIQVTKLNKRDTFWINENLIEFIEETPDTVISLATGRKVIVAESAATLAQMVREVGCPVRNAAAISSDIYVESD
ncbi:MAG: endoflagellar protein [Ruminococcaceae bacterium]|nr:endoflagellar protein [Oscillospiraceae bacterium]